MYANDFAAKDAHLRVHMIGHGSDTKKSDAFLLEYQGAFVMIDGGMEECDATIRYLLDLRAHILSDRPELIEDPSCRLRLRVMISHCHRDQFGRAHYPHLSVSLHRG